MHWIKKFLNSLGLMHPCGCGMDRMQGDAPVCNQIFWTQTAAMFHYIRSHRQPRRIQIIGG